MYKPFKEMDRIEIVQVLGKSLDSRDQAQKLFNTIKRIELGKSIIVLNFDKVEFMSRSFADQFYQEKIQLESNSKNILRIEAANEQILEILKAVSQTQYNQNNRRTIIKQINVYAFPEMNKLKDYLSGI